MKQNRRDMHHVKTNCSGVALHLKSNNLKSRTEIPRLDSKQKGEGFERVKPGRLRDEGTLRKKINV